MAAAETAALADRIAARQGPHGADGHLRQRRELRAPRRISAGHEPERRGAGPFARRAQDRRAASAMSRSWRCIRSATTRCGWCSTTCTRPASSAGTICSSSAATATRSWQDYLDELAAQGADARAADARTADSRPADRQRRRHASAQHDDLRADPHAVVEVDRRPRWSCGSSPTTPPGRSSPARSSRGCDRACEPRYMRARAERIVDAARHVARQVGPARAASATAASSPAIPSWR